MKLAYAALAACAIMGAGGAAEADTNFNYSFAPGSTFNYVGFSDYDYALTGGFTYDATSNTVKTGSVTFNSSNGAFTFETVMATSPTDITISNDGGGDVEDLFFASSLANGGTDVITQGVNDTGGFKIAASGAVFAAPAAISAAPEPTSWALLLGGIAILGGMLRVMQARRREDEVKDIATA